jgi:hypothetical protein
MYKAITHPVEETSVKNRAKPSVSILIRIFISIILFLAFMASTFPPQVFADCPTPPCLSHPANLTLTIGGTGTGTVAVSVNTGGSASYSSSAFLYLFMSDLAILTATADAGAIPQAY